MKAARLTSLNRVGSGDELCAEGHRWDTFAEKGYCPSLPAFELNNLAMSRFSLNLFMVAAASSIVSGPFHSTGLNFAWSEL